MGERWNIGAEPAEEPCFLGVCTFVLAFRDSVLIISLKVLMGDDDAEVRDDRNMFDRRRRRVRQGDADFD